MPEISIRDRPRTPHIVTLPPVWGRNVQGQVGDREYVLLCDGTVVSRWYLAPRSGHFWYDFGGLPVRIAGVGGASTKRPHREQGYSTRLVDNLLNDARVAGYQIAMLFSLTETVGHYARSGWTMMTQDRLPVSFRGAPCPAHIVTGLRTLTAGATLCGLSAIDIEGLPW